MTPTWGSVPVPTLVTAPTPAPTSDRGLSSTWVIPISMKFRNQTLQRPMTRKKKTLVNAKVPPTLRHLHSRSDHAAGQRRTPLPIMDEVPQQRVYKENTELLSAVQPDHLDENTPVMTDCEVRRIIMKIKRSVTTEEKWSGKKCNFLVLRCKALQASYRSGGIPQQIWAKGFPGMLTGSPNEY